jgi:hypothetical protein
MMGRDHIFVQGSGGLVIKMDLPLHEATAGQLTKGYLRRVNEDGSPYVEPVEGDNPPPALKPPAKSATKAEWVGWAVNHPDDSRRMAPDDAEALTKDDLMERFGKD